MNASDLYNQRDSYYFKPSQTLKGGLGACFVIAALAIIGGFVQGDMTRLWGAFLLNLFFFFSLSLGGVAFSGMQDAIGAHWGRPIKRLHEGFGAFLPVAAGLFLFFFAAIATGLFGADQVYVWIADPGKVADFHGKNVWLQKNFMLIRDTGALVVILGLAYWQISLGTKRDRAFADGKKEEAERMGHAAAAKLRYWCSPILVAYAFAFSLLAFDLLMSLSPLWFSTLWAGWLFAIMMQTLMATILVTMFSLRDSAIGHLFQRQQYHDVGKLMHGFTIFFAYLTYAHILTYWYGNVPEETEYFLLRMEQPWLSMLYAIFFLAFIIPLFALIFKAAKWTARYTLPICGIILASQWMTYFVVVSPEVVRHGLTYGPWLEIGVFFGFLGLFLSSYIWFGKRIPMVGLADPLLPNALSSGH